jgi:hypothetical protein
MMMVMPMIMVVMSMIMSMVMSGRIWFRFCICFTSAMKNINSKIQLQLLKSWSLKLLIMIDPVLNKWQLISSRFTIIVKETLKRIQMKLILFCR